jgi:type I restriction enzyme, S subunit
MSFDKLSYHEGDALNLPKGWEVKKLGEIGKVSMCKRVFKEDTTPEGDIPFYKIGTFGKSPDAFITKEKYNEFRSKFSFPKKGDILISASGTIGRRVRYDGEPAYFQDSNIVWIDNNEKLVLNDYLYRFYEICNWGASKGATISRLYNDNLKQIEIPFPKSLSEQQRIVSILDEAFAAIAKAKANAEQNLKNAKELFESYLQGVFEKKGDGWTSSTIGETCKLMTGGTPSTTRKEYYEGGNIKWLVSGDINQKEIFNCEGRITELALENSNARYLPVNSVLIALNGQGKTRGTVAMLRTEATCNQSLVSIYPNDFNKVLPELIYANLDGRYNEIRKLTGDSGNERRGLNMPIIRNISFSYPKSKEAQQIIVRQLNALRAKTQKLEAVYQKKIADLEELKKSILQKAFCGELKTEKVETQMI